jgi:L-aminopeptidase/D-esterase-like protein
VAFGFKGGIGTSSRRLPPKQGGYKVGVLVQTNFGGSRLLALPLAGNWDATTCATSFSQKPASEIVQTGR